jgi:hypothetical protein
MRRYSPTLASEGCRCRWPQHHVKLPAAYCTYNIATIVLPFMRFVPGSGRCSVSSVSPACVGAYETKSFQDVASTNLRSTWFGVHGVGASTRAKSSLRDTNSYVMIQIVSCIRCNRDVGGRFYYCFVGLIVMMKDACSQLSRTIWRHPSVFRTGNRVRSGFLRRVLHRAAHSTRRRQCVLKLTRDSSDGRQ